MEIQCFTFHFHISIQRFYFKALQGLVKFFLLIILIHRWLNAFMINIKVEINIKEHAQSIEENKKRKLKINESEFQKVKKKNCTQGVCRGSFSF